MLLVELADLCARNRAIEATLFEHAGRWTAEVDDPWIAAEFAEWSSHHAWHVELWEERFPAVPGLEPSAPQSNALDGLAEGSLDDRLTAALALLQELESMCEHAHRAVERATDAPTARVLELVLSDCRTDIARVDAVLASRRGA